jgi:hypothetical protein
MKIITQLLLSILLLAGVTFPQVSKAYNTESKKSDTLSFVHDSTRVKFPPQVKWGGGIGMSTFPYSISGETEFKQKLKISHLNPNDVSGLSVMFFGFLEWRNFNLEFKYSGNANTTRYSAGVNYLFKDIINNFLTPFAGVSISALKFSRSYEAADSIEISPGYKNYLIGVDINNNTIGYNLTVGISIDSYVACLSLSATNTWVSKKRGSGAAEFLIVDLSGVYFEAKLKIYFGEY